MRNSIRDIEIRLSPPRELSLDEAIEYLADDELLEITPQNIRIRKRILDMHLRGRQSKRAKKGAQLTLESQPC
jgi:GTP-binding protein